MKKAIIILTIIVIIENIIMIFTLFKPKAGADKETYQNENYYHIITREGKEFNHYKKILENNPIDQAFTKESEQDPIHMKDIIIKYTDQWKKELEQSLASLYSHLDKEEIEYFQRAQKNWEEQKQYSIGQEDTIHNKIEEKRNDLRGSDFYTMRLNQQMENYKDRVIFIKSLEFELTGNIKFHTDTKD